MSLLRRVFAATLVAALGTSSILHAQDRDAAAGGDALKIGRAHV